MSSPGSALEPLGAELRFAGFHYTVGYNAAISRPVSRWRMMTFALVLTGIMLIVIDFDQPGDGWIRVNTVSIENTIADMEAKFQRRCVAAQGMISDTICGVKTHA